MTKYEVFYDAVLAILYWEAQAEPDGAAQRSMDGSAEAFIHVLDATPPKDRVFSLVS